MGCTGCPPPAIFPKPPFPPFRRVPICFRVYTPLEKSFFSRKNAVLAPSDFLALRAAFIIILCPIPALAFFPRVCRRLFRRSAFTFSRLIKCCAGSRLVFPKIKPRRNRRRFVCSAVHFKANTKCYIPYRRVL